MAVDPSGRGCGQGRDGLERGESRVVHLELEQLGGAVSRGRRAVARVQPVGDVRPVTATAREVTTPVSQPPTTTNSNKTSNSIRQIR